MSNINISNYENVWLSSDTHYYHNNIIKYCNRPYSSVEEMNEDLIKRHNAVVQPRDLFIHLGDVSFGSAGSTINILERLNGNKILVRGNHDSEKHDYLADYFDIYDYLEIKRGKTRYILMHYPIESWNHKFHGVAHLHGHAHGTVDNTGLLRFDMGVDCWEMNPVNLDALTKTISEKKNLLLDYGKARRDYQFKKLYDTAMNDLIA